MNAPVLPSPPRPAQLLSTVVDVPLFIACRVEPKPSGGTNKIPCDFNGRNIDAHDSRNWLYAYQMSELPAHLWVGVVVTEETKHAWIDLDHAYDPATGMWTPFALKVLAAFPMAYREVSHSGTGLHIAVRYTGELPPHRTRRAGLKIEIYSRLRFMLTTGTYASGDYDADCTEALHQLIAECFEPAAEAASREWTTEAAPGYSLARMDDEQLLAYFLSKPPSDGEQAFNGGTNADVWNGTAKARERFNGDDSGLDNSLASRLAYVTGKNCERTLRLMQRAPIAREKWQREAYMHRTVLNAVSTTMSYPGGNKPVPEPVPAQPVVSSASTTLSVLGVNVMTLNKKGQYEATLENLVYVLDAQKLTTLGYDTFRGRVMVAPVGTQDWRPLTDTDMIQLRETLAREQHFAAISKELMRDALQLVAERFSFDSAITWLKGLTWDRTPRAARFLADYCGAADDDYTRAVSLYVWTGLASRVLDPGCQLDMVIPLISPQGARKSTGLQCMVPQQDCFTDGLSLQDDDDNFKRMIRGKLVIEIAELAGLSKADVDYIKRVITRRTEEWIEKWQTLPTRYLRRCMLFASTNNVQCLPRDDTGQRRWLPVEITKLDRERIAADCAQLWAEGAAIYAERGQLWQDAERLAEGRHSAYEQGDVWEADIERWLAAPGLPVVPGNVPLPPPCTRPLTLSEVLAGAIHLTPGAMNAAAEKRAGSVMRKLGYESSRIRVDGQDKQVRRWVRKDGAV